MIFGYWTHPKNYLGIVFRILGVLKKYASDTFLRTKFFIHWKESKVLQNPAFADVENMQNSARRTFLRKPGATVDLFVGYFRRYFKYPKN